MWLPCVPSRLCSGQVLLTALSFVNLSLFKSIGGPCCLSSLLWGCLIVLRIRLRNLAGRARSDVVLSYEMVSAFSSQFVKRLFLHQICAGSIIVEDFCFLESRVGRTFFSKESERVFLTLQARCLSQPLGLLIQQKSNQQQYVTNMCDDVPRKLSSWALEFECM